MSRSPSIPRTGELQSVPRVLPHVEGTETASALAARLGLRGLAGTGVHRVHDAFAGVLPGRGLERGRIYGVRGSASVSLLYGLVAEATRDGAWFAIVDMPRAGLVAADENGIAMQRLLSVSVPHTSPHGSWSTVVGAIVDGVDLVAVSSPRCGAADARRLAARARASGAVVFVVGNPGAVETDATFTVTTRHWCFDTHARSRTVDVECAGRRMPSARRVTLCLPGDNGGVGTA